MATSRVAQFGASKPNIINGQNPAEKSALMQGQIDARQPILYYDLEKELAFVFLPNGLQLTTADQERIIGGLTNSLVNTLPAEQRKFYLLNPKPFLSLDSLIKAVLEADGITEEMLEAQAQKIKLLESFLKIDNEADLKSKIKENDDKLDREFFEILTASMQAAQFEGNAAFAQALFALRSFIARYSTQGRQAVKEIDDELGMVYIETQEELLEKLQSAKDEQELEALVAAGYDFLDYGFFQKLTGQLDAAIKAGDKKKEAELKTLRSKILEIKGQQEERSQAALQKAVDFLQKVLRSSDPAKFLEKNIERIDNAFFAVLSANIQEARRQKSEEAAKAMEMIGHMAMSLVQAQQRGPDPAEAETAQSNPAPESKIEIAKS